VPDSHRIGPINDGWSVAITTLMAERSGISGRPSIGPGRAEQLARRAVETGAWDSPTVRDRLLRLFVDEHALQMTTVRALSESSDGVPGAEGSIRKLV
jgi:alkylation response protein AidB-like acyl-CoA dehydrogenase